MAAEIMTHRARMEACLSGDKPDCLPVALWRHFPVDDQSAVRLATATLDFQRRYEFDFIKVSPASSYCLVDWGARDEWQGATEGTREYTRRVIQHPDDWTRLRVLDPNQGQLAEVLTALQHITSTVGPSTPVIQTIFNPLSQAKNLVGKSMLEVHLRRYPEQVALGLETIVESTRRFIAAAAETGIAGIFFAVQHAQYSILTPEEYLQYGKTYDLQVLETAQDLWLNVMHIHGAEIMFDLFLDYPVQVLNWHDQETFPSLRHALTQTNKAVCGGLRREQTLVLGTPEAIQTEAEAAFAQTGGRRFILGTGCVVPVTAPHGNLWSVVANARSIHP